MNDFGCRVAQFAKLAPPLLEERKERSDVDADGSVPAASPDGLVIRLLFHQAREVGQSLLEKLGKEVLVTLFEGANKRLDRRPEYNLTKISINPHKQLKIII